MKEKEFKYDELQEEVFNPELIPGIDTQQINQNISIEL